MKVNCKVGKCYLFIQEIKQTAWVLVSWTWVVLNVCIFCYHSCEKSSRYILLGNNGPLWLEFNSLILSLRCNRVSPYTVYWCYDSPTRKEVSLPMDTSQMLMPQPKIKVMLTYLEYSFDASAILLVKKGDEGRAWEECRSISYTPLDNRNASDAGKNYILIGVSPLRNKGEEKNMRKSPIISPINET